MTRVAPEALLQDVSAPERQNVIDADLCKRTYDSSRVQKCMIIDANDTSYIDSIKKADVGDRRNYSSSVIHKTIHGKDSKHYSFKPDKVLNIVLNWSLNYYNYKNLISKWKYNNLYSFLFVNYFDVSFL